ncbi:MAG: efflux RND transporter permease subunit, partial [Burkholderiales bacterium]
PWEERSRLTKDIVQSIAPQIFGIPGILGFPVNPPSLGQSPIDKPIEIAVLSSVAYSELQNMVDALMEEARKFPGLTDLDTDLRLNKPELKVDMNRDKASDIGVEIETIGRTLETLLGGRKVTRFKRNGEQYEVIVKVADVDRTNPIDISNIWVHGKDDQMVQLSNLLTVTESVAPRELNHFNKLRAATITANVAPGYTQGDAIAFLEQAAERVLPPSADIDYKGQAREFKSSSTSLYITFLLALAFIYLVLSAQFESFADPLIIMLSVPLSMAGALLALKLTGGTLNVYSQIGLVTLVGLITKHGILIVEFANQQRQTGKSPVDAVIESATLRLRPILMTTGAMVLGSIPLALATGAGAESREQIGWVIVGGLLVGTLFTLFVIPTAYTLLAGKQRRFEALRAASQNALH